MINLFTFLFIVSFFLPLTLRHFSLTFGGFNYRSLQNGSMMCHKRVNPQYFNMIWRNNKNSIVTLIHSCSVYSKAIMVQNGITQGHGVVYCQYHDICHIIFRIKFYVVGIDLNYFKENILKNRLIDNTGRRLSGSFPFMPNRLSWNLWEGLKLSPVSELVIWFEIRLFQ
jgi:hypothetical protein